MIGKKDKPTVRCGYCDRRFPAEQSHKHWTWSMCNFRPAQRAGR